MSGDMLKRLKDYEEYVKISARDVVQGFKDMEAEIKKDVAAYQASENQDPAVKQNLDQAQAALANVQTAVSTAPTEHFDAAQSDAKAAQPAQTNTDNNGQPQGSVSSEQATQAAAKTSTTPWAANVAPQSQAAPLSEEKPTQQDADQPLPTPDAVSKDKADELKAASQSNPSSPKPEGQGEI